MLAIIRVFTTNDQTVLNSHAKVIAAAYGIETKTYCIPEQYYGIHGAATEKLAIPKIVKAAETARNDGAKCILISCAADPGLEEARAAVDIPVIGAGSCAAGVAIARGTRVGVLNLTGKTPRAIARSLGNRLAAEASPPGVDNTTDLLTPLGQESAVQAIIELKRKSDVIMFGCTGFTTIGLERELRGKISIPAIDAIEAAGAVALHILSAGKKAS